MKPHPDSLELPHRAIAGWRGVAWSMFGTGTLLAAIFFGGCDADKVGDPQSSCEDDMDCDGALVCDAHPANDEAADVCQCKVGENDATCSQDGDCPNGQQCGVPTCQCEGAAGDCSSGQTTDGPIVVTGTDVEVDVSADNCGIVCSVGILNGHDADVFATYAPFAPSDPIQLVQNSTTIPAGGAVDWDVQVSDCSASMQVTFNVQFFDDVNGMMWEVPVNVTTHAD